MIPSTSPQFLSRYLRRPSWLCALIGSRLSRSKRTTCWLWAMTLVLTVVGLPACTTSPLLSIFCSAKSFLIFSPIRSSPIKPASKTRPPRLWMLCTTLAAPPSRRFSLVTATTGTGASGEMRETVPQINSSIMMSPTTRRVVFLNCSTSLTTSILLLICRNIAHLSQTLIGWTGPEVPKQEPAVGPPALPISFLPDQEGIGRHLSHEAQHQPYC